MSKPTLLILFGGRSNEYDVSLMSACSILKNVDRAKYQIETVGITRNGDWYYFTGTPDEIRSGSWCADPTALEKAALSPSVSDSSLLIFGDGGLRSIRIDVIFPVMHGAFSEDGTLQGLLQMSGIPFVGPKCAASAIGMDKGFTKLVLKDFGIPQAKSLVLHASAIAVRPDDAAAACEALSPYPLFVKPANAGSSVGASKASDRAELARALDTAAAIDTKVIVEEYIDGKEIEVAVIGKGHFRTSTCGQIVPGSEFYDYDTKYSAGSTATYKIPADIRPETAEKIRETATRICTVLGIEGLSRVDFFVFEKNGREEFLFNEINTLPGFTEISMYPKLMVHDGLSYSELIDRLIGIALSQESEVLA